MNARAASWGVPAAAFALAAILSVIGSSEGRAAARPPGAATGACVCDLKNLKTDTVVDSVDIKANSTYDLEAGIPANDTNTWIDNEAAVVLTVDHTPRGGAPRKVLIPSDMNAKPPKKHVAAFGVKLTPGIAVEFDTKHNKLDASVRAARGKLGGAVTEDPNSRTPLLVRVLIKAKTTEKGGGLTCADDITQVVTTAVDLLGNGTGTQFTPN